MTESPAKAETGQDRREDLDLVDVGLTVWHHRWVALVAGALIIAAGVAWVVAFPVKYEYSTTIEIGSQLVGGRLQPLESNEAAAVKLENTYVPEARRRHANANGMNGGVPRIKVMSPSNSDLVVLISTGSVQGSEKHIELHEHASQALITDHKRITSVIRADLDRQLRQAEIEMRELQDPETLRAKLAPKETDLARTRSELESLEDERVFAVKRKRLENALAAERTRLDELEQETELVQTELGQIDRRRELLELEIADLRDFIAGAREQRAAAAADTGDASAAMSLLLFGSEIRQAEERISSLSERLFVELPYEERKLNADLSGLENERALQQERIEEARLELDELEAEHERAVTAKQPEVSEIESSLLKLSADHKRAIDRKLTQIDALQVQLDNLRETRRVLPPQRSPNPSGISKSSKLILSMMLAVFAALIAVFCAAYVGQVSRRLKQQPDS